MPKHGFSCITVPSKLYEKIRIESENESLSIADYLKQVMTLVDYSNSIFVNRWSGVQVPPGAPLLAESGTES